MSQPKDSPTHDNVNREKIRKHGWLHPLSTLHTVKLLVFFDMLSVALVVPLMSSYFRDLNISTELYGLVTSVYSAAQILGGLVLGTMSDRVGRRSMLVLSFIGSAVSYGLVGVSKSLWMLLLGRVIVGLVKQTMTISTALVSDNTDPGSRAKELSHLGAAATISFIVGPTMGSFLYQQDRRLPPLAASSIFFLNSALAMLLLPAKEKERGAVTSTRKGKSNNGKPETPKEAPTGQVEPSPGGGGGSRGGVKGALDLSHFLDNFKFMCTKGACMRLLLARLFYGFLFRSLSPHSVVGYFEERFQVESYMLGYISSYRAALSLLAQVYLVGRLSSLSSEPVLVAASLACITVANLTEAAPISLPIFLVAVVPLSVLANSLCDVCLKSLFTQRIPRSDVGAALGTLNVLSSAVGVLAPAYGGELLGHLGVRHRPTVAGLHFAVFTVAWCATELRGVGLRARGWQQKDKMLPGANRDTQSGENGRHAAGRPKTD